MRRPSIVSALAIILAAGPARLLAQDPFGTWQGTLATATRPLRLVFDIARDNGRVKVVQFSIDQTGFESPVTADTITLSARRVRIVFSRTHGTFEGVLNA